MGFSIKKALGFVGVAKAIAAKSKDRSTKVAALALGPAYEIRSTGWNGFPRGVNDDIEERHQRPAKYKYTVHAEMNVVAQAARPVLEGSTLLLTSLHPCSICSGILIQAGVKRILTPKTELIKRIEEGRTDWDDEARYAMEMLSEAGVEVVYYEEETL
jgi:dCMP deaminase